MNRRSVMTLAATAAVPAILAAGPLFAQSSDAGNASAAAAPMPMGEAETKHMQDTMRVGGLALLTSRVAQQNATDPLAKAFAKWEVTEQETIADVLKSMQSPDMKAQGQLQPPSDAEVEAMLDAQGKEMLEQMRGMQAGAEFDAAYLRGQLDGHQQLLAIQEEYLQNGQNREHLAVAKLARAQITEHIEHLQGMTQSTSSTQQ